jgi:hypothetical protein
MNQKLIYSAAVIGMATGSCARSEPFFSKEGIKGKSEIAAPTARNDRV